MLRAYLPAAALLIGEAALARISIRSGLCSKRKVSGRQANVLSFIPLLSTAGVLVAGRDHETDVTDLTDVWALCHVFGNSNEAVLVLQETGINPMTDGTFLGIAALWGRAAAIALTALLLLLSCLTLYLSMRQTNYLGKLIGAGAGCGMLLQTIICVVSRFLPVSLLGTGMPVFSYGGTVLLVEEIIAGTVLGVMNYRDITPYEMADERISES